MSDDFEDYYELLRCRSTDSLDDIRRAYYREVRFWFPDKFVGRPDEDVRRAADFTVRLNRAWEILRNPDTRRDYDELRTEFLAASTLLAAVVACDGTANFTSIGEAIASLPSGGLVLIRPGRYAESVLIEKPVKLLADGALSEVVWASDGGPCLEFETECEALVRGISFRGGDHPALTVRAGAPVFENCAFTCEGASAAVWIVGRGVQPVLKSCRMHDGHHYGLLAQAQSSPTCRSPETLSR